jgi:hypothetical protein
MNKLLAYDFRVTNNAFSILPVKVNTLTCLLVRLPACLPACLPERDSSINIRTNKLKHSTCYPAKVN